MKFDQLLVVLIAAAHFTVTKAMRLTPLQASTRLPSRVAIMLRTMPPPEGIAHV
jgi:hypothetical protein